MVDAGPLIALFHAQDPKHHQYLTQFQSIFREGYTLYTPFPILCEVHKLIQQFTSPLVAQNVLISLWQSLEIICLDEPDTEVIIELVSMTSDWQGTLQDASVITLARQMQIPVWTLDFRDFSRFNDIHLWS